MLFIFISLNQPIADGINISLSSCFCDDERADLLALSSLLDNEVYLVP